MLTSMPNKDSATKGPVFIVGLSRSGTKLLRDILNGHPQIQIPIRESHFIPYALKYFGSKKKTPDPASRREFIHYLQKGVFYRNMADQGFHLPTETLTQLADSNNSWSAIIESIFRHYAGVTDEVVIWGDKTPKYLNHMRLLRDSFPGARFLHIYRDPRDRVLSAHRAWGANIYIAAQQWVDTMKHASLHEADLGQVYKKVSYEHLVTTPSQVVQDICTFLDINYFPAMLKLGAPAERRGDPDHPTRKSTTILATNTNKYRIELTARQLSRVEQIVFPFASELGYLPDTGLSENRPLRIPERLLYSIPHYFGSLRMLTRRWGLVSAIKFAVSGWRL